MPAMMLAESAELSMNCLGRGVQSAFLLSLHLSQETARRKALERRVQELEARLQVVLTRSP
jgi:hypothetical protein